MRSVVALLALTAAVLAGCGGEATRTAVELRACVNKHLPPGAVDRVFANTEAGVTSINYFHRGGETDLTIFKSAADAEQAEKAEARLGDAHDRRVKNVLYSGGGVVEQAIVDCLR
jgi:hypothetical protein